MVLFARFNRFYFFLSKGPNEFDQNSSKRKTNKNDEGKSSEEDYYDQYFSKLYDYLEQNKKQTYARMVCFIFLNLLFV